MCFGTCRYENHYLGTCDYMKQVPEDATCYMEMLSVKDELYLDEEIINNLMSNKYETTNRK